MSIFPHGVIADSLIHFIMHTVAFYISLVHYVKTIFIAKVIEIRVIRVMRSAYSIKVEGFHLLYIVLHLFLAHYLSRMRVGFVAVHSFEEYAFAVYQNVSSFYLNRSKAYGTTYYFFHLSLSIVQHHL